MGSNIMRDEMVSSSTFKVSDVKAEKVKQTESTPTKQLICSQLMPYGQNHCTEVLMETQFSPAVRASYKNGFVNTVIDCYNKHHNLIIRPDNIWTAILTQFSFYINKNAEEFRNQFVNFDGKKELVVTIGGVLRSAPYDIFVTKMTEKIHENLVDGTVKEWILPSFTTTTPNDVVSCGVVFMATMKKYFEFTCFLKCGIPNITLEGTVEDWENIQNRLEKLKVYKLDKWYNMLKPILKQFIAAKNGKVDKDFWNRICHRLGGGSGPSFISGWLTVFTVFNEEGNWTDYGRETWPQINIRKIPCGIVGVDVKITDDDGDHESIMFAGHIAHEVLEDRYTLKPQIGWGIALKLSSEEVNKLHEVDKGNQIEDFAMSSKIMAHEMASSSTFKVSDVKAEKLTQTESSATKQSICSQLMPYVDNHCTEVLMETQFSPTVRASYKNGFVNTVIDCYNNHHNLIIRPDDIWTAILTQFSFYINKNAEEFRNQFVNFNGKKELVVKLGGVLRSAPYDIFVTKMTDKIHENLVDETVKDWILPNFTTTTPNDVVSCGVIFMATMKKYFEFGFGLLCGIPNITLEGTVEDWENIHNRLEKLKIYKLDQWYNMLEPILNQFIAAKSGKVDTDFWNRICHHLFRGSGPRYISGWLTVFAVFDEEGNWTDCGSETWPEIDIDEIPCGIVCVDVKITDDDGDHESIMFAGHIAHEVLEDQYTLKPQIGWGIALKLSSEEVNELHEVARANRNNYCYQCKKDFDLTDDESD